MNIEKKDKVAKKAPYSNPDSQIKLIKQDVARIKNIARITYLIDDSGNVVHQHTNNDYQLNIIAVIGPAFLHGEYLQEVILLEVGISRTRPYHEAIGRRKKFVQYRRKVAILTEKQFSGIWPVLEKKFMELSSEAINGWPRKSWKFFKTPNRVFKDREMLRGVRFSVSHFDEILLTIILRSEINKRQTSLEFDTGKAARFLSIVLRGYSRKTIHSKKILAYLSGKPTSGISRAIEFLKRRKFLPHAFFLIFEKVRPVHSVEILTEVCKFIGLDMEEIETWGNLIQRNTPVFQGAFTWCLPRRRNGENLMKIYHKERKRWQTKGHKKQDYLVFELIPTVVT